MMEADGMPLHEILKELRNRAGLKLPEVQQITDISRSSLFNHEAGTCTPTREHLRAYLSLYGPSPIEQLKILQAYLAAPTKSQKEVA